MEKIWSYEVLSALCRHKKPIVREWAINRLNLLYPEEAGDVAIKLISDQDGIVAKKAVDHFLNHPTGKYKDDLLNLYKKSSGRITGRIANVLSTLDDVRLIDAFKEKFASTAKTDLIGYPLTVVNIAMLHADESKKIAEESLKNIFNEYYDASIAGTLFMANLIAGTDIETLLNFCYRHPDNLDLVIVLLTEIDGHCGSWYSAEDLEEKGKKGLLKYEPPHMVKESLDYIEAQGYKDTRERLEKLFRKGKYEDMTGEIFGETSAIIEAGEKHIGEDAFNRWQNGNGKPRRNIRALAAFKDKITSAPGEFREPIARIAISLFARVIEYKGLIGLDIAKADTDGILGVFLQERGSVEDDDKIEEILAKADDREKVVTACLRHIEERPESWANLRIVRLIGKAGNISDFARLLETDADHTGLWDEIVQAIERFGTSAVDIVKPIFERFDESKISYALQVLRKIPVTASTDIIIKHWDRLWTTDKEGLLEAVRGIGDRRFIEPLKKELREGERYEAEIFHLLCLINNIIDPQFRKVEKEIDKHKQKVSERLDALKSSDINKLLKEPLKIELKCRACYRAYHYDVEKITITEDSQDKFIIDKIKCKNCGVVDHYEITPAGEMAVTSHLMLLVMGGKKVVKESPFIMGKSLPVYGKQMSMNETVTFYENKIKDHPKNPEYLLGYANTLRKAKRTEDAVPVYENTAALDPLAVEAYVSLGNIAGDKGDYKSSYEYFKKAAGLLHSGNYYKLTQDMDQFKEAVLDNLAYIGDRLGVKPFTQPLVKGESGRVNEGMRESIVKYPQAGRNAPCPCGSGKKYKKCCLQKEVEPKSSVEDRIRHVEKALTDRLLSYSKKFHEDFLNAMTLYWRTEPIEPIMLPETALEDKGSFMEWFVIDYLLPSGKTILEEFYSEMFNKLTDEEKKILESHMTSCMNMYEILDVREGSGLRLKELFTGSEMDVVEIKGSQKLVKWDIIMVRIYSLNGINRILSPIVQVIPRTLKDRLTSYLSEQFERFKQETGITGWQAFMKKRSYIILHYIEDLPEEKKILLTEERHKIVLAKALFDAKESEDILDLLENEYDFVVDKVVKGKEAQLTWLKRGKSKELQESEQKHQHGLVMQSKLIHESGQLEWTVVGNIIVTPGKMTLECMSKERLQRGKQRLQEILGDLIKHKFDTFEDIEKRLEMSDHKETKDKPELSDKSRLIIEASMMRFFKGWLDDKVPSLDGMSPREAVKTPAGKQKVIELIRDFENTEERKRKDGEPYFDIGILKKEFGLD